MDEQALVLGMVVSFSKQYSSWHLSKLETSHDTRWTCASCQHGGVTKTQEMGLDLLTFLLTHKS
jgi:hypothetical protein